MNEQPNYWSGDDIRAWAKRLAQAVEDGDLTVTMDYRQGAFKMPSEFIVNIGHPHSQPPARGKL